MTNTLTADGRDGRLLGEDELRQISRSIRSFVPQEAQKDDNDDSLNQFRFVLDNAFFTSSHSGLSPGHRVAAWNTLCSLIDQAQESKNMEIKQFIWVDDVWGRAFQLYLNHAQTARPKSSRQLLVTLTSALRKAPRGHADDIKSYAADKLTQCLRDFESPAKAKASAQFLSHLLSKDVLELEAVLLQFDGNTADFAEVETKRASALLEASFRWLGNGDFGSTIGQLVLTVLDKLPTDDTNGSNSIVPIWSNPLEMTVVQDSADVDALRVHIFPVLFKRNFADFLSFLNMQGLEPLSTAKGNAPVANEGLLFAALQAGKDIGLIHETDDSKLSNDGKLLYLPIATIGRLLSRASRTARLTGLMLLINSHTTTRPFSERALGLIKNVLQICAADVDADFRSDIFSAVQKLVDRIRSITAVISRQQTINKALETHMTVPPSTKVLVDHRNFLEWLLRSLAQDLRPTASYQRRISALKCLHIFARSGLDGSVPQQSWSKNALGETKWPFNMSIMTFALRRLLLDLLMDPFDDVRQTASSILTLFAPSLSPGTQDDNSESTLLRAETAMLSTGRADHADGVAHLYAIQHRSQANTIASGEHGFPGDRILDDLMIKLEQMLAIARENLAESVAKYPMHGLLTSLRYVLESGSLHTQESIFSRLFADLKQVWDIVKPVLCNDAPEGYQPEEQDTSADSTKETLSYCWRALKEASLLLNVLINTHQPLDKSSPGSLVEDMSHLCFAQLAELRHRGAFSTVAQTWTSCCMRCASLYSTGGHPLLDKWYEQVLDMLRKNVTINTRRSAGLPSLLCGILIAQKSEASFDRALKDLENISRQEVDAISAQEGNLAQVHAMNCIKDILKNTRLGERSEKYVAVALQLAADALRSKVWAIRNCGLMLFRAVIDRLLGTDQSHFEDDVVPQKHVSVEEYPELLNVILGLLPRAGFLACEQSDRNEGVFPALRLLQHTRVPTSRLQDVKTAVMILTASPSWHIRDKAARAVAALLDIENVLTETVEYQSIVQVTPTPQNALHGILLTTQYFVKVLRSHYRPQDGHSSVHPQKLREECTKLMQFAWTSLFTKCRCHTTKATCIDIMWECNALLRPISEGPQLEAVFYHSHDATEYAESQAEALRTILPAAAPDPGAAVFRQAFVRLLAQQLLFNNLSTEKDSEVALQILLQVAEVDKNACEYFFHAIDDYKAAVDEQVAPFVARFAGQILDGQFDVVLKCAAQEALLNLSSEVQSGALTNPGIPLRSAAVTTEFYNQRYADNHIQLQAICLERTTHESAHLDDSALNQIKHWSDECVGAINDKGVYTRDAAAGAIDRIELLWKTLSNTSELQPCFLRLCVAIYDLLNDDEEDTRLLASRTTQHILATASGEANPIYEPIVASQKLLGFCVSRWPDSNELVRIALEQAFGTAFVPVAEQLASMSADDTALFAREKQNLYIDDAQEVRVWSRVVQKLSAQATSGAMLTKLSAWVVDGLKALKQHALENIDGPLGWSSKAESFTLGLRIIYGVEVLFVLVRNSGRLPIQPSALRLGLFEAITAFESAQVHPIWLWEMKRVLTESLSHKTKLVTELAASGVRDKSIVF